MPWVSDYPHPLPVVVEEVVPYLEAIDYLAYFPWEF